MKNFILVAGCWLLVPTSFAQPISQRIGKAYKEFEADSQLSHAISSLYVINAKTGEVVFDKNSQIGLAPASTQKIITAATAFELLGKTYRYKTLFSFDHGESTGRKLFVYGHGDPTFGSWRFNSTKDSSIWNAVINKMKNKGDSSIDNITVSTSGDNKIIPSGWIYEDLANYYGAASYSLNWHENQYDFDFIPGQKIGDAATLINDPKNRWRWRFINNECKTGPTASGDNAYIYFLPGSREILIQGTIPLGVNKFRISGADIDPMASFSFSFSDYAISKGITIVSKDPAMPQFVKGYDNLIAGHSFYTHYSPSLDSIIYWFLQKSINLYGEALIKTFAYEKKGFGSTDTGVVIVKGFWKQKGIDEDELNIMDGSGLSPQNRVTAHAEVEILKYAKSKDWFPYFYNALPAYNGMKMKSGSIRDVKGYCGYHKSNDGNEYIFSFLVNNYNGSSSGVVNKMYRVLDALK